MARTGRKKTATKRRAKKAPPSQLPAQNPAAVDSSPAEIPAVPVPAWRLVTREQLATLMGVHPDTVTDNVRRGMPMVSKGGHGKEGAYDAVACLDWQRSQLG